MANEAERGNAAPKQPSSAPKGRNKKRENEQEVLREQSKTEIEENPYLDTEGGE